MPIQPELKCGFRHACAPSVKAIFPNGVEAHSHFHARDFIVSRIDASIAFEWVATWMRLTLDARRFAPVLIMLASIPWMSKSIRSTTRWGRRISSNVTSTTTPPHPALFLTSVRPQYVSVVSHHVPSVSQSMTGRTSCLGLAVRLSDGPKRYVFLGCRQPRHR